MNDYSVSEVINAWQERAEKAEQQRDNLLELLKHIRVGAMHEACGYEDPDPTWHCCTWAEVVEMINKKLEGEEDKEWQYTHG